MYGVSCRGYNVWRLIEFTMYGNPYRRYNLWRLISRVQFMETHIKGTMYGDSYKGTMYGESESV